MLTKSDIQLLIDNFVTKSEFNQAIDRLEEKMVTKVDHDRIMTTLDAVLTEVRAIREEFAMHAQRHEDVDEKISDHDKRIKKLETSYVS